MTSVPGLTMAIIISVNSKVYEYKTNFQKFNWTTKI